MHDAATDRQRRLGAGSRESDNQGNTQLLSTQLLPALGSGLPAPCFCLLLVPGSPLSAHQCPFEAVDELCDWPLERSLRSSRRSALNFWRSDSVCARSVPSACRSCWNFCKSCCKALELPAARSSRIFSRSARRLSRSLRNCWSSFRKARPSLAILLKSVWAWLPDGPWLPPDEPWPLPPDRHSLRPNGSTLALVSQLVRAKVKPVDRNQNLPINSKKFRLQTIVPLLSLSAK